MIFTRSQIETTLAALVAAIAVLIGVADRIDADDPIYGPKFLGLERVGTFNQPVYVAQPPGSERLVVVEKPGRIVSADPDGDSEPETFLDIRRRVKDSGEGGEQGLMSIAFAPGYARHGRLYISYTDRRDALRIVELRRAEDGERALRSSARLVLKIPQPTPQHHSGMLAFGPDGFLYIGSGDGGPGGDPQNVAQNRRSLRGKILRINPRKRGRKPYTVPGDNPYVRTGAGRKEIFALGLRNPWRFAFDPVTGAFAVADVGDARFEEVSRVDGIGKLRGANFGWAAYEGFAPFRGGLPRSAAVMPLLAYPHGPACSITGGPFVRDTRLRRIAGRQVVGAYMFGDFCTGNVFTVRHRPGKRPVERKLRFKVTGLTSFGQDSDRRIYLASLEGPVFRITARRKQIGGG